MFDFFKHKLMTSKFGLTGTEKKLARKFGEDANIPIYRKGLLTFITGIQGDIYEQRQYAYNANIIISDEEVFDLSIPSNINKLTIKEYAQDLMEYSITFDLAYIIKMRAGSSKDKNLIVPLVFKAKELMEHSPWGYTPPDYGRLVTQLYRRGFIKEAQILKTMIIDPYPYYNAQDKRIASATEYYYTQKAIDPESVPKSFNAYLNTI